MQNITKQGYLTKQGGMVRSWRRRWFVLRGNVLAYYKNADDLEPAGTIILRPSSSSVHPASRKIGRANAFEVITEARVYSLFADDSNDMDDWITHIKRTLNQVDVSSSNNEKTTVIRVKGMMCDRCVSQVRKVVYSVTKIDDIEIKEEEELLIVKGKINVSELQEELEEAGFIPSIQSQ